MKKVISLVQIYLIKQKLLFFLCPFSYITVHREMQEEKAMAHICYLCLYHSRQAQIHMREMHQACVHSSITFSFCIYPPPTPLLAINWKRDKIKVMQRSTWSCRRINFHILMLSRPTDSLKECSLVMPGNIWLVKTHGMFARKPPSFSHSFLVHLTHDTQIISEMMSRWVLNSGVKSMSKLSMFEQRRI